MGQEDNLRDNRETWNEYFQRKTITCLNEIKIMKYFIL